MNRAVFFVVFRRCGGAQAASQLSHLGQHGFRLFHASARLMNDLVDSCDSLLELLNGSRHPTAEDGHRGKQETLSKIPLEKARQRHGR